MDGVSDPTELMPPYIYLGHDLNGNNEIIMHYVCVYNTKTSEELCLKASPDAYDDNVLVLNELFNESNCYEDNWEQGKYYECSINGQNVYGYADTVGFVEIDDNEHCTAGHEYNDGEAVCSLGS